MGPLDVGADAIKEFELIGAWRTAGKHYPLQLIHLIGGNGAGSPHIHDEVTRQHGSIGQITTQRL